MEHGTWTGSWAQGSDTQPQGKETKAGEAGSREKGRGDVYKSRSSRLGQRKIVPEVR